MPFRRELTFALAMVIAGLLMAGSRLSAGAAAATPYSISTCSRIEAPGSYAVTTDLSTASASCLVVVAPDVSLDLGGHTITGALTGTGITVLRGATGTQIAGGTISRFSVGVEVDAPSITLTSLSAETNRLTGVEVLGGSNDIISRSNLSNNGWVGLYLQTAQSATITDSTISDNSLYGIALEGSSYATITGNIVASNQQVGIYLGCPSQGTTGMASCSPSSGNTVARNFVDYNGDLGIAVDRGSDANSISGNQALSNGRYDLYDANLGCGRNLWQADQFSTHSQSCQA